MFWNVFCLIAIGCISSAESESKDHPSYTKSLNVRIPERVGSKTMPNITLVTHLTSDRKQDLIRWCKTWRGPISTSLFLKPNQIGDETIDEVWSDDCLKRHCSIHLVERTDDARGDGVSNMYASYPFNVQRNAALSGAVGEWVFVVDIDFEIFPPAEAKERRVRARLSDILGTKEAVMAESQNVNKVAFVVPAVETVNKDIALPRDREELLRGLRSHEVVAFYGHHCRDCHHPTNVELFAQVKKPYHITYAEGYEPYVILNKALVPSYDERFVGRGWSKMSFFFELNARGWGFAAMPGMFLVHKGRGDVPHGVYNDIAYQETQQRNRVHWDNFKSEVLGTAKATTGSRAIESMISKVGDTDKTIDWSVISSSMPGEPQTCASVVRDPQDEKAKQLLPLIEQACSIEGVDCSPLFPQGIRNQTQVIYRADWAFDRAYHEILASGLDNTMACNFAGMGHIVRCPAIRQCCSAKPTASDKKMSMALSWVCGPHALGHCPSIFNRLLPDAYHSLRNYLSVAMSFYVMMNSCTADIDVTCDFDGIGEPVACKDLFSTPPKAHSTEGDDEL